MKGRYGNPAPPAQCAAGSGRCKHPHCLCPRVGDGLAPALAWIRKSLPLHQAAADALPGPAGEVHRALASSGRELLDRHDPPQAKATSEPAPNT